jgi:1-phosphatidylinositol-3-phosphate 5-kinase
MSVSVLTQAALVNDSRFLSELGVMDYSLLVGLSEAKGHLVIGIIDYLRQYTWDKQLETYVKSSGVLGGGSKQPTIISPKLYKERFLRAMMQYLVTVRLPAAPGGERAACAVLAAPAAASQRL